MHCLLSVPVCHGERLVGIVAIANRASEYGASDSRDLAATARHLAPILDARVRTREALAASERKYRLVADNTYDWEVWTDPAGRFLYSSPSCERITGYPPSALPDVAALERIVLPADRLQVGEHLRTSSGADNASLVFRIQRPDGSVRWIAHDCLPVFDGGRYLGRRGSHRDVTEQVAVEGERARAQDALRESRAQLVAMIESALDAIVSVNEAGKVVVFNAAAQRMFGRGAEDVLGKPLSALLAEGKAALQPLARPPAAGPVLVRVSGVQADGTRFPLEASLSRAAVAGRSLSTLILRDLRAREEAERYEAELRTALRRAAREWSLTFDALESAVVLLDEQGVVLRLNRAAAALTGRPPAECSGQPLQALGEGEPWRTAIELIEATDTRAARTASRQTKDEASGRSWDVAASSVDVEGQVRHVVLARDESAKVRLLESMQQAEQMAAMGAVTAGVAHEVRNPLFAISANVDALALALGEQPDMKEAVDAVRTEVQRLNRLMVDLLHFGRSSPASLAPARLDRVVDLAASFCAVLAAEKGVEIRRSRQPALVVRADREMLAEALENVIENAIQHSQASGVVEIGSGEIDLDGQAFVRCTVADSGPGFKPEDLPLVFRPFFTRRRGGTGLGLSIVRRTVEQHAGRIHACNRPEGGGMVNVDLPLLQAAASEQEL